MQKHHDNPTHTQRFDRHNADTRPGSSPLNTSPDMTQQETAADILRRMIAADPAFARSLFQDMDTPFFQPDRMHDSESEAETSVSDNGLIAVSVDHGRQVVDEAHVVAFQASAGTFSATANISRLGRGVWADMSDSEDDDGIDFLEVKDRPAKVEAFAGARRSNLGCDRMAHTFIYRCYACGNRDLPASAVCCHCSEDGGRQDMLCQACCPDRKQALANGDKYTNTRWKKHVAATKGYRQFSAEDPMTGMCARRRKGAALGFYTDNKVDILQAATASGERDKYTKFARWFRAVKENPEVVPCGVSLRWKC